MARELPLHVAVHFVGRAASGPLAPAAADYAARLGRLCRVELLPHRGGHDVADEGRTLLAALRSAPYVALDVGGRPASEIGFRHAVEAALRDAPQRLTFVLGGAAGLAAPVLDGARARWSLSTLTLSHDLARVVLLEQLYRVVATLTGSPYAK